MDLYNRHWESSISMECYDSKLKGLSNELTFVLSDIRELDRIPSTEQFTLYTSTHGPC